MSEVRHRRTLLELLLLSDFGRLQPDRARVPGAARLLDTEPAVNAGSLRSPASVVTLSGSFTERSDVSEP
jgi:hypothetical protein